MADRKRKWSGGDEIPERKSVKLVEKRAESAESAELVEKRAESAESAELAEKCTAKAEQTSVKLVEKRAESAESAEFMEKGAESAESAEFMEKRAESAESAELAESAESAESAELAGKCTAKAASERWLGNGEQDEFKVMVARAFLHPETNQFTASRLSDVAWIVMDDPEKANVMAITRSVSEELSGDYVVCDWNGTPIVDSIQTRGFSFWRGTFDSQRFRFLAALATDIKIQENMNKYRSMTQGTIEANETDGWSSLGRVPKVLLAYRTLWETREDADAKLIIEGKPVFVHKTIPRAHSEYFKKLFRYETEREKEDGISLERVKLEVMEKLLCYLYCGNAGNLYALAPFLLEAADRFQLPDLKDEAEQMTKRGISVKNVAELLLLSVQCSAPALSKACAKYASQLFATVSESPGWRRLQQDHPEIVTKLSSFK